MFLFPASRKVQVALLLLFLAGVISLIINLNQWRASINLMIARQALRDRDTAKAMAAALEAARLIPESGEAYFLMARAFRRTGQLDKVQESLLKAAQFGTPHEQIRREEWLALAQAGQMKEARPHLSELLLNPGDDGPEICEAFTNGFFLNYQLGEAFRILDVWEKDFPHDAQPYVFRGEFSSKTDDWIGAAKNFRKACELAPNRQDIQIKLAAILLITREMDDAAVLLERLLRSQPDNPEVLMSWAEILLERGQNDQAQKILDQMLQTDPNNVVALRLLGVLHSSAERHTEAIQYLEKAIAIEKHDPKVRYALGLALQRVGRAAEAQKHFEFITKSNEVGQRLQKLIEKARDDSEDAQARFEIAELLREKGKAQDRLLWLRSVVELDPKHKEAHAELAKCYAELGQLEASRKHALLAE